MGYESGSSRWLYLHISEREGPGEAGDSLKEGSMEFSFDDLGPGTYDARIYGQYESKPLTFVLTDQGDSNLLLRFEPE